MSDPSLIWIVDQDQLNLYVCSEGDITRTPHNSLMANMSVELFPSEYCRRTVFI
jgi:hypothetical protein